MPTTPELDTASAALAFARQRRRDAQVAETDVMIAALTWAEQHPPESIHDAAFPRGGEVGMGLAGEGAPQVAEFCIPELAAAIGVSTDAGRTLISHALELAHRLPKVWARVVSHELPVWRARRIAERTIALPPAGARFVDDQLGPFAHKTGPAAVERLVTEAVVRFDPDRAAEKAQAAWDGRHVLFHHEQVSATGTTWIEAQIDLADALDLDAALSREAAALAEAGCTESLDVRRAMALGILARGQGPLAPGTRDLTLYVHLDEGSPAAEVEQGRRVVTVDQVRTWCQAAGTRVTIKPVVDLHETVTTDAYAVPDRIAERIQLRDRACVFPWCERPARRCESDHVVPHSRGGPTSTDNLAPLCKRHHRLKTHALWRYTVLEPGTYLWSSPHGYQFLRDHTGTADVTLGR